MKTVDIAVGMATKNDWHVFPLKIRHDESICDGGTANCKVVDFLGQPWRDVSSNDPKKIRSMPSWNGANAYGIDCGKSGLFVVDVDPSGEWDGPDTREHGTGRGRHYIYSDDVYGLQNGVHLRKGVDVRGVGGMIIGPGSWHPHGDYIVLDDIPPAPVPDDVISLMLEKMKITGAPNTNPQPISVADVRVRLNGIYLRMERAEKGERNNTLNILAGTAAGLWTRLRPEDQSGDLDDVAIQDALRQAALKTGLVNGIGPTIRSGWLYGLEHPVPDDPTPEEDFGVDPDLQEQFFTATPVLEHIRKMAHSRLLSAPGLLCYTLARVLTEVPPDVCLPPVIGDEGSLNLGIALVGSSGSGKSSLLGVSRQLLGLTGLDQQYLEGNIGSGEGLVQSYLRMEGTGPNRHQVLIDDPRRIFVVDEIDHLNATQNRKGATLASTLRSALTGSLMGQENADADRRRHVPAGSYRCVLLMAIHPTRSAVLLDDLDVGTPQRLVWISAVDKTLSEEDDWRDEPGPLDWELPADLPRFIDYPNRIKEEIRATRRRQVRGEDTDPLAGHLLLTRLKVSTALSLLHGETKITDQWWELAGKILEMSMSVQAYCRRVILQQTKKENVQRGQAEGKRELIKTQVIEEDGVKRCMKAIKNYLMKEPGKWVVWDRCRPAHRLREYSEEALERLVEESEIEVEEYKSDKGVKSRKMRVPG